MGFKENLRAIRKGLGLTQQDVADRLDKTREAVTRWESGATKPTADTLAALADVLGVSTSDLMGDAAARISASLPSRDTRADAPAYVPMMVLGSVHAGEFDEEAVSGDGDVVNVPSEVKERWPHARAVRARGTCMNKAIPDGHWFLVDPGTEPRNGDIAVVETEDHEAVVRRWYRGGDTLMLVADSTEHHEDIVIHWEDGAVRVIGTVVYEQGYLYR